MVCDPFFIPVYSRTHWDLSKGYGQRRFRQAGLPPTEAEHLPDDAATLKGMVLELLASLHDRDRNMEGLQHRIHLLLRRLYGPRGERFVRP